KCARAVGRTDPDCPTEPCPAASRAALLRWRARLGPRRELPAYCLRQDSGADRSLLIVGMNLVVDDAAHDPVGEVVVASRGNDRECLAQHVADRGCEGDTARVGERGLLVGGGRCGEGGGHYSVQRGLIDRGQACPEPLADRMRGTETTQ